MTDYKVLFTEADWSHLALAELWESSARLELLSQNNDIFEAAGKYRFKKKKKKKNRSDVYTNSRAYSNFVRSFLRAFARIPN